MGGDFYRGDMLKVDALIASLDAQLAKRAGYQTSPMRDAVDNLKRFGKIEIGWRESCGKTDPTMYEKRAWDRVAKALRAEGMQINEERKKHGNAYATSKGGFWCSIVYSIELLSIP